MVDSSRSHKNTDSLIASSARPGGHLKVSSEVSRQRLDGHKLHLHPARVAEWQAGERIAPIYIDMGITQTCNVACKFCYYMVPENRTSSTIPTDALIEFLKCSAEMGVKAIGFLGDGEPTLHPGVYDAVEAGANFGLDMAIATNGVALKSDRLPKFLESLSWIRFTLAVGQPEAYQRVMGGNEKTFEKVVKNIKRCVEIKKELELPVVIGMQMVLIEDCLDQVVPQAELGRRLGVDYFVVKQTSESGSEEKDNVQHGLVLDNYSQYEEIFLKAEAFSDQDYKVVIKREKMDKKTRNYQSCYGCEFLPQITGKGDVYPCGNHFEREDLYIGNIVNESFREIVFGDRYAEVMRRVKEQINVHTECGVGCRQNEINEYLYELKADRPAHANFI
jgi:radical SAM protein with 4Fe4S-binding SPASM domain